MTMAQIENIYRQAKLGRIHAGFYKDDDWYVDRLDEWALQERDIAKTDPSVIDFEAMFRLLKQVRFTGPTRRYAWARRKRSGHWKTL